MNEQIYKITPCIFGECAFPLMQCNKCIANPNVNPKDLVMYTTPKLMYKVCLQLLKYKL